MFELWVRVMEESPERFVGFGVRQWRPLYDIVLFIPHVYSSDFIRHLYYQAKILMSTRVGGRLQYDEHRLISVTNYPSFVRIDHVDPRHCQAIPIGLLDLIGLCKKPEESQEKASVVLPRGNLEERSRTVAKSGGMGENADKVGENVAETRSSLAHTEGSG